MLNWQKKENKDAKDFKGRKTPRSGGMWSFPGDVVGEHFLIDCKTTNKKGFRITAGMWRKLYNEALKSRRLPCLSVSLTDENIDVVVLDKNDWITLLENGNVKK